MLAGVLRRARIHGLITNRDLLVEILTSQEFLAEQVSTAFLEGFQTLAGARSSTTDERSAMVAAAIGLAERTRAERTVQQGSPVAWRNVVSQPQRTDFETGAVDWWGTRDGYRVEGVSVIAASPTSVSLETQGVRTTYDVAVVGPHVDVDSPHGHTALTRVPRFVDPADAVASGSLLAPMPGSVVGVLVEAGAEVGAGDTVLVLEAMKMQHTVAAPYAGTVVQLNVKSGAQVAAGDVLAVVEEM